MRTRVGNPAAIGRQLSTSFRTCERGSLTIFSLFLFILILFCAGMAVDLMRYETRRVTMQNTLDSAILAASSLKQSQDAETVVKTYFERAGFDPDTVQVQGLDETINEGTLVSRSVVAVAPVEVPTFFMGMMGIETLSGNAAGRALESVQNVEISLVVDISGSMGNNDRLKNLKVAAKEFIDLVIDDAPNGTVTSVSIVPYNATVVVGDTLLSRLNAGGSLVEIEDPSPISGALSAYRTDHDFSTCIVFDDNDFKTRAIGPQTELTRVSHFARGKNDMEAPSMSDRWCNDNRAAIMPHSTNKQALKDHIDSLSAGGWTGIDNGMKWGVALLDPALSPVIDTMVTEEILTPDVASRPSQYDRNVTMKVVVLMTDGDNTQERDLRPDFKSGPSRVWYSQSATEGEHKDEDRDRTEFDGYFVLMPDNDSSERWYVPGSPKTKDDDTFIALNALPNDAVQLDHHTLYARFAVEDLANFFFKESDSRAHEAYLESEYQTETSSTIDARLQDICDQANLGGDIRVFAIGFEAPQAGLDAMKGCASAVGNYFDVEGTEISDAFKSIAGQITALRLTN